jgi:hypothetical protein
MKILQLVILFSFSPNIINGADRLMAKQDADTLVTSSKTSVKPVVTYTSTLDRALKDPTYDGYYILRGYIIQRVQNHLIRTQSASWLKRWLYHVSMRMSGCLYVEIRGWADIATRDDWPTIVVRTEEK